MNKLNLYAAVAITAGSLMAVSAPASAQTIGFKLGPTWSTIDVEGDQDDTKHLQSLGGGGFLRFGMMGIGMQAEVLALSKGAESEEDGVTSQFKIEYIEIPIMARFGLGSGAFAPYIMAGPAFAFNYSCDASLEGEGVNLSADCDQADEGFEVKQLDIGVTGVAGLEFRAGPGNLLIEGRYTHGLTNIFDGADVAGDAKNRSFAVRAGYAITLGR